MRHVTLCLALAALGLAAPTARATDHNEPDILDGFFADRAGSGADIYGIYAYPSQDGATLNLIMTLAPVPASGEFDPNSVQRIYLSPTRNTEIDGAALLQELADPKPRPRNAVDSLLLKGLEKVSGDAADAVNRVRAFEDLALKPIIASQKKLLSDALASNNVPYDQASFPEIRTTYSKSGKRVKVTFRNFSFPDGKGPHELILTSNGNEAEPRHVGEVQGIRGFAGGRDDPFYTDIGGFFRSINHTAAINDKYDFIWKGKISWKASPAEKESNDKPKRLIDRDMKVALYSGKDWREGNNVNVVAFTIPMSYVVPDRANQDQIKIWAESFLTEAAHNRINY